MLKKIFLSSVLIAVILWPGWAQAAAAPEAKVFDLAGKLESSFAFFLSAYAGSADLAVGDVNGDGLAEIAICPGSGSAAVVKTYSAYGVDKGELAAYADNFRGGCYVSAGDVNGDGQAEIVTAAGYGGGPHLRIFEIGREIGGFFAFALTARQGARVQAADLGSDGKAEIIAYSNLNAPAEYKIFGNDGHLIAGYKLKDFNSNGLSLAIGDFNGDGVKELAIAGGYGNQPIIRVYGQGNQLLKTISYGRADYLGGLNLAAADVNGDGRSEIIVTESFEGGGAVSAYDFNGDKILSFDAYAGGFHAGVKAAAGDVDGDGQIELVLIPERINLELAKPDYKFISVDLTKQTLYRYQNGALLDQYLISSGKAATPTPVGDYQIYLKRPNVRMSWYFGPNNPMNYDLPNVPWVASFLGPYTIHGTYWHSNFGHTMSHGCVNMRTPEAKVVYDWSEIGTPVVIN